MPSREVMLEDLRVIEMSSMQVAGAILGALQRSWVWSRLALTNLRTIIELPT